MKRRARRLLAACGLLLVLGTASGCGQGGDGGPTGCVNQPLNLVCF